METCEILIVGGGPAGSSCAHRLHDAGIDVAVIDKSPFPRDKVCAGWITPAVISELELDIDDYRQQHVCQQIQGFRTGTMDGNEVYNDYKYTISYGIRRFEFDDYLLRRSGARLLLDTPVNDIEKVNSHWIINGNIRTSMLVGAGGHFCPVARHLGARVGGSERSVSAQEIEFKMTAQQLSDCTIDAEIPQLYFYPDMSGYGWIFRKDQYINIGVGREQKRRISEAAKTFLGTLQQDGKIPADITGKFRGHAYLLYDHARRRMVDDAALLIGDAAGLAYTESGEGIRPAIESGLLAASTIIDANSHYGHARLRPYTDMIKSRFGKKQVDHGKWIPERIRLAIASRIISHPYLSRHILLDRFFLRSGVDTI